MQGLLTLARIRHTHEDRAGAEVLGALAQLGKVTPSKPSLSFDARRSREVSSFSRGRRSLIHLTLGTHSASPTDPKERALV